MKSGPECTHTLQQMITDMNSHLADDKKRHAVLDLIGAEHHPIDNGDVQLFLAENFVLPIQYSDRTSFCKNIIEHSNKPFLDQLSNLMEFTGVEWEDYDRTLLADKNTTNDMR